MQQPLVPSGLQGLQLVPVHAVFPFMRRWSTVESAVCRATCEIWWASLSSAQGTAQMQDKWLSGRLRCYSVEHLGQMHRKMRWRRAASTSAYQVGGETRWQGLPSAQGSTQLQHRPMPDPLQARVETVGAMQCFLRHRSPDPSRGGVGSRSTWWEVVPCSRRASLQHPQLPAQLPRVRLRPVGSLLPHLWRWR